MKQEYQDRIDDYLLHRMSDKDKRAFEDELSHNEELREQLIFTKSVIKATKSRNEKLAAMKKWRGDHHWKERRVAAVPMNSLLYLVSGLAAVLVVGFFLSKTLFFGEKYEIKYTPSQMEFGSIRTGGDYTVIERLLIDKDYNNALIEIEREEKQLAEPYALTDTATYKERMAYDQMYRKMRQDKLTWMKVYALLGLGRHEEAVQLLDLLRESDGEYKKKADSLYNFIK